MAATAAQVAGMAFVPYFTEFLKVLDKNSGIKRTIRGMIHQITYGAVAAVMGAILFGPPGALVGSVIGSVVGFLTAPRYDPLITVLRRLSSEEREELVQQIQGVVGSPSIEALGKFASVSGNKQVLINLAKRYTQETKKTK